MQSLGFDALVYDYTPVPFDLDGSIMIPSLLKSRNMADDMHEYWCERGYLRIDPDPEGGRAHVDARSSGITTRKPTRRSANS